MMTARNKAACRTMMALCCAAGFSGPVDSASAQTATLLPADGEFTSGQALSFDGRYATFGSPLSTLVPGDTNAVRDVFVYDHNTAGYTRISVSTTGVQANAESGGGLIAIGGQGASLSPDGRFVAFLSLADNLVAGDTNMQPDVFLRDRDVSGNGILDQPGDVATTLISVATGGAQGDGLSTAPAISGGTQPRIAFHGTSTVFDAGDNNGTVDVYLHDTATGTTTLVSQATGGGSGNGASWWPSISADGNFVVYNSAATDLVAGDTNAGDDVFLYNVATGTTTLVSQSTAGIQGDSFSFPTYGGAVSADGRHVTFSSWSTNLVSGDNNGVEDVFVRDTVAGTTARVSIATDGTEANDTSSTPVISADGRFVQFASRATNIGMPPGPSWRHMYLHDRDADQDGIFDEAGATMTHHVSILSIFPMEGIPYMSADASTAAVTTAAPLVPGDTNNGNDSYLIDLPGDSDGDGLLDSWETTGIDSDGDGTVDLTLPGANPNRKDIFIEIDGYAGRVPPAGNLNAVVNAFANAPVSNPDGSTGITLHLVFDETSIPMVNFWTLNNPGSSTPWSDFANEKAARFGTAAERGGANWTAKRAAKVSAYRYCFFANQFPSVIGTQIVNTVSGMAELRGNDFFISMGAWTPAGGTIQQMQGVFMHELGHCLGLQHGGLDPINYKPNYHSVMNYNDTVPAASGPWATSWNLDFSDATWATLNESCLNEFNGIGGPPNHAAHVTAVGPPARYRLEWETGAVHWNTNGVFESCVASNVNQVPGQPFSPPGEVLLGHNDWANLVFIDPTASNWANGVHGFSMPVGDELRYEQVLQNDAGDCNDNGIWDADDIILGNSDDCDGDGKPDECRVPWYEDFEQYDPAASLLDGEAGWKGWDDDPAFDAPITDLAEFPQPRSPYQSLKVEGDADVIRPYCYIEPGGAWSYSAWQYIPSDFESGSAGATAGTYFMLLNTYNDNGPYHWSVEMQFDSNDHLCKVKNGDGNNFVSVPYVTDRWVKIQTIIDLEDDWTRIYYDDELVTEYTWTGGVLGDGGGALDIAVVDLYANGSSSVYYDDLRLDVVGPCGGLYDDGDGDGLTAEDELRLELDPCNPDTDQDGAPDGADNCPSQYNPLQFDSDGDSVGDACEKCHGFDDLEDCNNNALPDACDVLEGVSDDDNGNLIPDECETPPCVTVEDCADIDGNGIRDDGCVFWSCIAGGCVATDVSYADMGGSNGECFVDGAADGNDRFHALNCFSNQTTLAEPGYLCEANPPAAFNVDAASLDDACQPDGVCDGNDAFAALNAFSGNTACSCSGPAPSMPGSFTKEQTRLNASLRLVPRASRVQRGAWVDVDVYLARPLADLRGYQLHAGGSAGSAGGWLELIDMYIDPDLNHVFAEASPWSAFNLHTRQLVVGLDQDGVAAEAGDYLVTLTLRADKHAAGRFTIDLLHDSNNKAHRSVLFATAGTDRIQIGRVEPAVIEVGTAKRRSR